jgi:hypothetical protein
MATPTTSTKRRQPGRKAEDIHLVWKEQAPDAVFAGKSLADLEAARAAAKMSNEDVSKLTKARSAALKVRDEKTAALKKMLNVVVRGVEGHADHGEDSPLYRAMGFVPKSERKSGLTRRSKAGTGETAGNEEAAV